MKRILIFSLAYYPHVGGAEIAIKEITDRIPDIEFHMLTLNFGGEAMQEKIGNVFVHRIGNGASYFSKILFIPRAAYAARGLHSVHRFEAFWAMMTYMLFPVVVVRLLGVRIPYLLTLQDGDPFNRVFRRWYILPFRPLLSFGFRHATAVQTISAYLAGWARRAGVVEQIKIIPNGTDTRRFAEAEPVNISKKAGEVILVSTSRLVHKNALDDVIRSLSSLPHVRFVNYGFGPDKHALEVLARSLGVADRVALMPHPGIPELPPYLKAADIFIRPSRSEGMGNSFIEAMAAGLPVIATQEGGIADFLFDAKRNPDKGTTGWAVDKDSPEQIALAVKDILAHPEQVARVKATAKALVLEKYDWNLIAAQMRTLFDQMLEKR
ncbi:MAG: glycosyltransferase family 4 protein [Minisyncoccota bacterium]